MGSFAASVALPEQLRPWAMAGLSHLYLPEGLPLEAALPAPDAQAQAVAADHQPAEPVVPASPQIVHEPLAQTATPVWPEPWRILAARVRTSPRVIITYAALADDVSGAADPARRKLFQTALAYLAWPQGTSLFWPISFPTGVDPGPFFASDIFAEGVHHFNIRHVVCFGDGPSRRAKTLFPQDDKAILVHAAPAPEELVGLLPHELHQALAHLKALAFG